MSFNESNTVEQMILDAVGRKQPSLGRERTCRVWSVVARR